MFSTIKFKKKWSSYDNNLQNISVPRKTVFSFYYFEIGNVFYDCALKNCIINMGLILNYIKYVLNILKVLDVHNAQN